MLEAGRLASEALYLETLTGREPKPSALSTIATPGRALSVVSSTMSSVNWWITTSFWGSGSARDQLREPGGRRVDLGRVDPADDLAGHLAVGHAPLGVERQPHVGLAQPLAQPRRLGEEVRATRLDVEHEQRLGAPRGAQVAADHRVGLAQVVAAAVARIVRGDDRDQLERGHDRAAAAAYGLAWRMSCATAWSGVPMPSAPSSTSCGAP